MGTVYVVQEPKTGPKGFVYDISSALRYGTPAFVFKAGDQPSLTPGPSIHEARLTLKDFCDEDYVLWAGGDPAGLVIVTLLASDINQGRVNFLRWERERRGADGMRTGRGYYVPVELSPRSRLCKKS